MASLGRQLTQPKGKIVTYSLIVPNVKVWCWRTGVGLGDSDASFEVSWCWHGRPAPLEI